MNAKKIVTAGLALVMVAGISVAGTLAYLTSTTGPVTNTFTVGAGVDITLNEGQVGADGKFTDAGVTRVTSNEYALAPGGSYDKDPTVHVTGDSCWVFVTVENPISDYEGSTSIAAQMTTNGWVSLGMTDAGLPLYGYGAKAGDVFTPTAVSASSDDHDLEVFTTLTIGNLDNDQNAALKAIVDPEVGEGEDIVVTAYAIQSANMNSVTTALDALGLVDAE